MAQLDVHELALELLEKLKPLAASIARRDRNLAQQLRRAATSIALNIAEGEYSDPGTAKARFNSAAGSGNETRTAVRVARAWGYIEAGPAQECLVLLDRILAMLWNLKR